VRKKYTPLEISTKFNDIWNFLCDEYYIKCDLEDKNRALKFVNKDLKEYSLSLEEAIGIEFLKFRASRTKSSFKFRPENGKIIYVAIDKSLAINSNSINTFEIIESLRNLTSLTLAGNNLSEIIGLNYSVNLKNLIIMNTKLEKINLMDLIHLELD